MSLIYDESFEMIVENVEERAQEEEYHPVQMTTSRGLIDCRYYRVEDAEKAVILVGGVGGDWDTPARGLYPLLGEVLRKEGIASLRVQYRNPTDLVESTLDVLAGLIYLQDKGVKEVGLVGHSFGGAVVIQAAAQSPDIRTVITLATQSYGTDAVTQLGTGCSLLLLHGTSDLVLPPSCSQYVYQLALEPKRLIMYPDAGHGLDEVADEVYLMVRNWIVQQLNRPTSSLS
ncbi:dienelactone hydrolase family protein [Scytonema sp. NUACC21]